MTVVGPDGESRVRRVSLKATTVPEAIKERHGLIIQRDSGTLELQTKAIPFAGAVLQRSTNASGYFLGTNQSGRVLFEDAPVP